MDDKTIVSMYWDKNEQAIAATSEKYGNYCMSIALNILGSYEDAEECVNEAYLNTWNSIPPKKPAMLSTYLGKIVRNLSLNRYRQNSALKRGQGQMQLVFEELAELIEDPNGIEEAWDRELLTTCINAFLATLPEKKRRIFVRRYWYADSVKDIAESMHMSQTNVSVTLNRLRAQLHNKLKESGFIL